MNDYIYNMEKDKKANPIALAMILRAAKRGRHIDRKKRANKGKCRERVENE